MSAGSTRTKDNCDSMDSELIATKTKSLEAESASSSRTHTAATSKTSSFSSLANNDADQVEQTDDHCCTNNDDDDENELEKPTPGGKKDTVQKGEKQPRNEEYQNALIITNSSSKSSGELQATEAMCLHCFDVLLYKLLSKRKSATSSFYNSNSIWGSLIGGGGVGGSHHSSRVHSDDNNDNQLSHTNTANRSENGFSSAGTLPNDGLQPPSTTQQSVSNAITLSTISVLKDRPDFVHDLPVDTIECPLFVTWDKQRPPHRSFFSSAHSSSRQQQPPIPPPPPQYELRGCIGTLSPRPLQSSIGEYALLSALRDKRFDPIVIQEMVSVRVAVSLLVKYEDCENCHDWTVGVHGIMIRWSSGSGSDSKQLPKTDDRCCPSQYYSATYLPEVAAEQGWDQTTAIQSLIRKAGYHGRITQELLARIKCTRYQSSKYRLTFAEYVDFRRKRNDPSFFVAEEQQLQLEAAEVLLLGGWHRANSTAPVAGGAATTTTQGATATAGALTGATTPSPAHCQIM